MNAAPRLVTSGSGVLVDSVSVIAGSGISLPTYSPVPPWSNGQQVTRNTDGVLFIYSASLNALTINPNVSGIAKNANSFIVKNLPTPTNSGDAANKSYVDTHVGGGGGIADAPSDGFTYSRINASWTHAMDGGSY
jgi:hypothetical protein